MYATRVLCEVANERGVPTADVLAGTAIEPADLDDPDAVVGALDEITAVRRLLARLPDDAGIGIDVGSRFALTHFGVVRVCRDVMWHPSRTAYHRDALFRVDHHARRHHVV